MGEGGGIGLVGLGLDGLEGLRGFDQGSDAFPLCCANNHDHQHAGNQRHSVDVPILHGLNVGQIVHDANALLGLANGR